MFQTKVIETKNIFGALDIGSSKVSCAVGKIQHMNQSSDASIKILGIGYQLSKGLRGGNIIDIEDLEDSILNAVHAAEQSAQHNIRELYVSIPGRWIVSHVVKTEISLSKHPISQEHLQKIFTLNSEKFKRLNQHVLHILPLSYSVDNLTGITDPKGMVGQKLEAKLLVMTTKNELINNISLCISRCHLDVAGFIAAPYASAMSTLLSDEMSLGVTHIDIGAGQTTVTTFKDGSMTSTATIPLGGIQITHDIAKGLGIDVAQAERLKNLYGNLFMQKSEEKENIVLSQVGEVAPIHTRHIARGFLVHIIRSRIEEILEQIMLKFKSKELDQSAFRQIVVTGGVSQIQGLKELITSLFGLPTRLSHPMGIYGTSEIIQNPSFSVTAGLLLFAAQEMELYDLKQLGLKKMSLWKKITSWIRRNM
ncbi:MAG: cell division protein FtsA [Candidatus Puniceispirillum sp.]|nr:cell division protein FtsA [Candidatus Pelagibacter sp.]MBA4283059.1 cell division protein FtsA [Candidatus Puniceispirillum sp.]